MDNPNPNPMDHLWTTLTLPYGHSPMDNPNPMDIHLWTTLTLWTFTYGQP